MTVTEDPAHRQEEEPAGHGRFPKRLGSSFPVPSLVWIAMILLSAVIVGGIAGLLSRADGASVPGAILTGGGSFAGTVALLLAIAHFARSDSR